MTGRGVAFTAPGDGDMRGDEPARRRVSDRLGISPAWATVEQIHGAEVVEAADPGPHGPADAIVSSVPGLPAAVFTADCLGVVLHGDGIVGVVHAGWRGLQAGVLEATVRLMARRGGPPSTARIGPAIGPCCFEVGGEVADLFPQDLGHTTWGTRSVDLVGAARRRLAGVEATADGRCTACGGGPSHRRDGTLQRMATIGWVA